ncbi:hypothetical protein FKM82_012657 [Ascaphus truei]
MVTPLPLDASLCNFGRRVPSDRCFDAVASTHCRLRPGVLHYVTNWRCFAPSGRTWYQG